LYETKNKLCNDCFCEINLMFKKKKNTVIM